MLFAVQIVSQENNVVTGVTKKSIDSVQGI